MAPCRYWDDKISFEGINITGWSFGCTELR
jgi:hypothetical protein